MSIRQMTRSALVLSLALACAQSLVGCGGGSRANVSAGTMPSGETFTGVWHSPQYGEMQLVQTGNAVAGEYVHDERRGRIEGSVTGDLMRFQWTERRELVAGRPTITRGRGYFRFNIGDDNDRYIVGEWGHDDNETGGGPWRAVRDRRRRPSLSGGSASSTSGGEEGDSNGGDAFPDDGGGSGGGDAFPGGSGGSGGDSGGLRDDDLDGL